MRKVLNTDVFYQDINTQFIADAINGKTVSEKKAGAAAAGTVTLTNPALAIDSIQAFTASSGAAAAKALLSPTTDYTFTPNGTAITMVTDQSLNTLVINYHMG